MIKNDHISSRQS